MNDELDEDDRKYLRQMAWCRVGIALGHILLILAAAIALGAFE